MQSLWVGGCWVRMTIWAFLLVGCVSQGVTQHLAAQDLESHIAAAKQELSPVTEAQVDALRTELKASLASLDQLLIKSGEDIQYGWHEYLEWPELNSQVSAATPDLLFLGKIRERLRRKDEGLELPAFQKLRHHLVAFIDKAFFLQQADQNALYTSLLDRLPAAVAEARANPNPENLSVLGRILGRLDAAGQAPHVVQSVRSEFGQPNLVARVSGDFISRNTAQPVDDTRPVSEMILGTHQVGTAHTLANVTLRPVPNAHRAELVATLDGTTTSENTGYRPLGRRNQVVIRSTSDSTVTAWKRIFLGDGSVETCPAWADACTKSTIHSVCAPELLSGLVTKQVYKKKGEAEAIAAQRLERRMSTQFDERVAESLVETNTNLTKEVHEPLLRLDAHPQSVNMSTTSDALHLSVLQAGVEQLSAPTVAPAVDPTHDAAIVMHQSAVNNLAEAVFGGKTIRDRQVAEWVEIGTGDLPAEFRINRNEPWSITFAQYQPVVIEFTESSLKVRIRGTRFTRGDEAVENLIEISAAYAIEKTENGVKLTRQGDVELTFPGTDQPTVQQTAVKSFLLEKFRVLFKDSGETKGVRFPGRFQEKSPMTLALFQMHEGWLQLAWQQSE